jgi:hypothetical protein
MEGLNNGQPYAGSQQGTEREGTVAYGETQTGDNTDQIAGKTVVPTKEAPYDIAEIMGGLYGDGVIGLKGAFSRDWVAQVGEDLAVLYQDALKRPGGAVGRGRNRHYVEIHPEGIRGFVELACTPGW